MPPSRRGLSLAFGLAAMALAAPEVHGSSLPLPLAPPPSSGFRSPDAGARLEPGATVWVAWDRPAEPSDLGDFDEMELLLSIDGGRSFPVRLTRDLTPQTSALFWRVPALPTRHARLALRAGDCEEPAEERVILVSSEFAIEEQGATGAESFHLVRGEWRTRDALDGPPPLPLSSGLRTESSEGLRATPCFDSAGESPEAPLFFASRRAGFSHVPRSTPPTPVPAVASSPTRLFLTLRL